MKKNPKNTNCKKSWHSTLHQDCNTNQENEWWLVEIPNMYRQTMYSSPSPLHCTGDDINHEDMKWSVTNVKYMYV